MEIKITRPCVVNRRPRKRNEKLEVSESDGKYLIGIGKAVEVTADDARAAGKGAPREKVTPNDE